MVYDRADRVSSIRWHDGGSPVAYFEYARLAGGSVSRILRDGGGAVYYTWFRRHPPIMR